MGPVPLRPPDQVMRPEWMGAARATRYSFSRSLIRRAVADRWRIEPGLVDLDEEGRGEIHYRIDTGGHLFHFIAFTTTIDESLHTDRVVAPRWEITAALCEGFRPGEPGPDPDLLEMVRREVPLQERARLDGRVLVLTRGNRSVRFFQYLVDRLARGEQPAPGQVADAGYIMRSTAFYGNGKFGMRSYRGIDADHPLGASYRAQFLCAWLFREISYVVVEHCARVKGGEAAVGFAPGWDRYFGLGNATGLGLVPYAFAHPGVIDAWATVREEALARVRSMAGSDETIGRLDRWIERAAAHYATGTDDDCAPFLNGAELAPVLAAIAARFAQCRHDPQPFDALYRWAETEGPETAEMVVSLLVELDNGDDALVDARLAVDETTLVDPTTPVGVLAAQLAEQHGWLGDVDLDSAEADRFWWLITDNAYEPRRAPRDRLDPAGRDVMVDIGLRLRALDRALADRPADEPIGVLLAEQPEHHAAVARLGHRFAYGEPHDNACHGAYLPLMVQRFQLATYGMDNFKPKSTDWLRVTLYQGAPRIADLARSGEPDSDPGDLDAWFWPPRPDTGETVR